MQTKASYTWKLFYMWNNFCISTVRCSASGLLVQTHCFKVPCSGLGKVSRAHPKKHTWNPQIRWCSFSAFLLLKTPSWGYDSRDGLLWVLQSFGCPKTANLMASLHRACLLRARPEDKQGTSRISTELRRSSHWDQLSVHHLHGGLAS